MRDVVSPHIEERLLTWRTLKNNPKEIVLGGLNSLQVTLSYEPFHIMVVVAGKPAITLNSRWGEAAWWMAADCLTRVAAGLPQPPHTCRQWAMGGYGGRRRVVDGDTGGQAGP